LLVFVLVTGRSVQVGAKLEAIDGKAEKRHFYTDLSLSATRRLRLFSIICYVLSVETSFLGFAIGGAATCLNRSNWASFTSLFFLM
jgi:hypothetical protein